jgi:hypothetical protein
VIDPPACPGLAAELVPLAELVAAALGAVELEDLEELPHAATARQAQAASRLAPQRRHLVRASRRSAPGRLRGLSPVDPTISPPLSQTTGTGRRGLKTSTTRELPQPGGERVVIAADHFTSLRH